MKTIKAKPKTREDYVPKASPLPDDPFGRCRAEARKELLAELLGMCPAYGWNRLEFAALAEKLTNENL